MRITLDVKPEPKRYNVNQLGNRHCQHVGSITQRDCCSESVCFANCQSADLWYLVSQLRIPTLVDDDSARSNRNMDK